MTAVINEELELQYLFANSPPPFSHLYVWDHFVLDYGAEKVRFVCEPPGPESRYFYAYFVSNSCLIYA